jgi:ribosomal protein S18 acetylase RimI-like enzyme
MAKVNDEFAGFVVIMLAGVLRGYIQTICMKPQYRGQGIGMELLKFSEDRLAKEFPNLFI